jgi:hypothetical protein
MPAIQPARLKLQSACLAEQFTQPGTFVRQLRVLLEQYADHTHRPGQAGEPSTLLQSYKTPAPVLRQVWQDLRLLAGSDPAAGLALCDALWQEPVLEIRILAARLLGQLPLAPAGQVVERLDAWGRSGLEERLVTVVLEQGTARLRQEAPASLLTLAQNWLHTDSIPIQQLGLRLLIPLIADPGFEALPTIFQIITPRLRVAPPRLRPDLLKVLDALALRSPQEAAYVLKQNLTAPTTPTPPGWCARC